MVQRVLVLAIIRHLSGLCRSAFPRGADQPRLSSGSVFVPSARVFTDHLVELAVGSRRDGPATLNAPQLRPCAAGLSTNDPIQGRLWADRLMHQGIAVAGIQAFLAYRCSRATVQ
jgi:hypothetical protein